MFLTQTHSLQDLRQQATVASKVFVQRDYTSGTICKFQTKFPAELESRIDKQQFEETIQMLNNLYAEAEKLGGKSYLEGCLACLTAYTIFLCMETHYEKVLKKIAKYIQEQNEKIYAPLGLLLTDPIERGLRVLVSFGTLAFPCFDGSYLPNQESEFVHKVLEELDAFQQRDDQKSVILFPPFPSRLRFLIHKTAEKFPELSTFSVGEETWSRRVAVCFSELRLPVEDCSSDTDGNVYEQPCVRSRRMAGNSRPALSRGSRRPDKAIYVPRALRQSECETSLCSTLLSASGQTDPSPANPEPEAGNAEESIGGQDAVTLTTGAEPVDCYQILSNFMTMTLEEDRSSDDTSQTSMACPNAEETHNYHDKIKAHLKEEVSSIENTKSDFSSFENVPIDHTEFGHVIEIYDFPSMFKTEDLLDAFSEYSEGGMKITWVDNTHALAIFSSESAAMQALSIKHSLLKTRTLSKASKKAQGKAVRRAEFLQPVKERPRTDTAVARRMVTRALGLRGKRY
ncbi:Golgin subfamily A member 7 [Bagarius yarrelli]|uniref:Golgin subfamily A member 7 n=1 Tax=Bagarius yarrelli TaxID=175774 RepID=A0A556U2T3_BAGYA|nr:Golgin subfamily A member 7 [Bagarius yarrelli]